MTFQDIIKVIGETIPLEVNRGVKYLSELGLNLNSIQSKILSLLILLLVGYLSLKIIQKPIKWVIIGLVGVLIVSIVLSFV